MYLIKLLMELLMELLIQRHAFLTVIVLHLISVFREHAKRAAQLTLNVTEMNVVLQENAKGTGDKTNHIQSFI